MPMGRGYTFSICCTAQTEQLQLDEVRDKVANCRQHLHQYRTKLVPQVWTSVDTARLNQHQYLRRLVFI